MTQLPPLMRTLQVESTIDFLPDGSVVVWTRGEGEVLFPAESEVAQSYRALMGPLAPRRRTVGTVKTRRVVSIDYENRVVTFQ